MNIALLFDGISVKEKEDRLELSIFKNDIDIGIIIVISFFICIGYLVIYAFDFYKIWHFYLALITPIAILYYFSFKNRMKIKFSKDKQIYFGEKSFDFSEFVGIGIFYFISYSGTFIKPKRYSLKFVSIDKENSQKAEYDALEFENMERWQWDKGFIYSNLSKFSAKYLAKRISEYTGLYFDKNKKPEMLPEVSNEYDKENDKIVVTIKYSKS